MGSIRPITLRFSNWMGSVEDSFNLFASLIEPRVGRGLILVTDLESNVDINISTVYGQPGPSALSSRVMQLAHSKTASGVPFGSWAKSFNLRPSELAKVNIFYTGENERPPYRDWDAYLLFDLESYAGKNAYLPLWWITCTEILMDTTAPYLGKMLTVKSMLEFRQVSLKHRKKFCIAFLGKAYSFRLHGLAALSSIEKVDIYGDMARKRVKSKYKESQNYRFVFCFENNLYPGYVTEKVIEAWGTGAVPLYWGSDPAGYINPKAVISLNDFASFSDFTAYVREVNTNKELWESIASQPILLKAPNLSEVNSILSSALERMK